MAVEGPAAVRAHVQLQPEGGVAGAEADGALVLLREVHEASVAPLRLGVLEHLLAVLQCMRNTGLPIRLFFRICLHENKGCILAYHVYGPYTW